MIIEESGMRFGNYDDSLVYRIEQSPQYAEVSAYGVSTCEFVLCRGKKILFVEAKSSCPRPLKNGDYGDANALEYKKRSARYNKYINEIVLKMQHSVELFASTVLHRHEQDGMPAILRDIDLSNREIVPILVINTKGDGWRPAPELRDALQRRFNAESHIWRTSQILVISDVKAREKNLIL